MENTSSYSDDDKIGRSRSPRPTDRSSSMPPHPDHQDNHAWDARYDDKGGRSTSLPPKILDVVRSMYENSDQHLESVEGPQEQEQSPAEKAALPSLQHSESIDSPSEIWNDQLLSLEKEQEKQLNLANKLNRMHKQAIKLLNGYVTIFQNKVIDIGQLINKSAEQSKKIEQLKNALVQKEQHASELEAKLEQEARQLDALKEEIAKNPQASDILRETFNEEKDHSKNGEASGITSKLEEIQKELATVTNNITNEMQNIRQLETKLKTKSDNISSLERTTKAKEVELVEIAEEIDQKIEELNRLQNLQRQRRAQEEKLNSSEAITSSLETQSEATRNLINQKKH
jgi:hypothetical protein